MNKLKDIFASLSSNSEFPIVVAHYERADFTVGDEKEFHWALVVIKESSDLTGPAWQAIDRHYSDGRGVVWLLDAREVHLASSRRCMGGVCIGNIGQGDIPALDEVSEPNEFYSLPSCLNEMQLIKTNTPSPKFEGWNCRDWIMETIELLKARGWVTAPVTSQSSLIPSLKRASVETLRLREKKKNLKAKVVDFESA